MMWKRWRRWGAVGVAASGLVIMAMVYATGHLSGAHQLGDWLFPSPATSPLFSRPARRPLRDGPAARRARRGDAAARRLAQRAGLAQLCPASGPEAHRLNGGGADRLPYVRDHGRRDRHASRRRRSKRRSPPRPPPPPHHRQHENAAEPSPIAMLHFHQVGSDQQGFMEWWRDELADALASIGNGARSRS